MLNTSGGDSPTPHQCCSFTSALLPWPNRIYNAFIPFYLANKYVQYSATFANKTHHKYANQAVRSISAAILGGITVEMRHIERKGTETVVCVCTGIFLRRRSQTLLCWESCAQSLHLSCFQRLLGEQLMGRWRCLIVYTGLWRRSSPRT
jgi:hypothetical protein